MTKKIRVGILFGGRSAEHEVSLQSAKNVIEAIDKSKYDVLLMGIDKQGEWHVGHDASQFLLNSNHPKLIHLNQENDTIALVPGRKEQQLLSLTSHQSVGAVDVIFPIMHGPLGEDGSVQGLLKLADIPFVGAGILGSAVGMDKDVMKRLLRDAGIPIAPFLVFQQHQHAQIHFERIAHELGLPLFVKPANLGSSVGVNKVHTQENFDRAIKEAFHYDSKILIEAFVDGREIECAVLGNEEPMASVPGEILPQHEFYSYEAKYIDEKGALLQIPADLPESLIQQIQSLAIQTFQVLCCEGMARVDCFVTKDEHILVNEINTIPGFTQISMYPKMWEASGISYTELIDHLLQLALQRYEREQGLHTSFHF